MRHSTQRRNRRFRPIALCLCLALLVLAGCGDRPEAPAEPAALEDCPEGDAPWRAAIAEAGKAGAFDALEERARAIAASCPDRWEPMWTVGEAHFYRRQAEPATEAYREALRRARAAGDDTGIANCTNILGWLAQRRGAFDEAGELYAESLERARAVERRDVEAFALNNLAGLQLYTGDLAQASVLLDRAATSLRELGREDAARTCDYNRGIVLVELGDADGAQALLEQVHADYLTAQQADDAARAAVTLGRLHLLMGRTDEAREWLTRVGDEAPEQAARARLYLGRERMAAGDLDAAAEHFSAAEEESGTRLRVLFAKTFGARVELERGRTEAATSRLEETLIEVQELEARSLEWMIRWLLGRAAVRGGDLEQGIAQFETAVALVDGMGDALDPSSEGLRFLRERAEPYVDLAASLIRQGRGSEEIFRVVEKAHARALRRSGGPGGTAIDANDLAAVQRSLAGNEVMLDYLLGEDRGILLAVGGDSFKAEIIPGGRALREPLLEHLERIRKVPSDRRTPLSDESLAAGAPLADALFPAPVRNRIRGGSTIYLVPDRELAALPPAGLPWRDADGSIDLLGNHAITAVMPMAAPVPRWNRDAEPSLLLGGDPLADSGNRFPELPYSAGELARIGEIWKGGAPPKTLTREGFTKEAFLAQPLEEFDTIHLATHAVASHRSPDECAIVFSDGERLSFDEIAEMQFGPALVVLSACRTGEGEIVPGEGVIGLSWAFLRAGARGVAVSQWRVADAATADLMASFHLRLEAGASPEEALHGAQLALRGRYAHPSYWSAFTVVVRP
ncbi:hypothetical protein ABI59_12170 [Acidobacteria bacterium Mor1]|nr:hypothetical protein ABI59_12170 [Acidobacteria bacterium Mor1]